MSVIKKNLLVVRMALLAVMVMGWAVSSRAVTFHFDAGERSAQAIFERDGNNLVVTLDNSSLGDVRKPRDVLTAVFFDMAEAPLLDPISASVAPGSAVVFASATPPITDVGGEWAYKAGLMMAPGGAERGISSSYLGLFGKHDRFPGDNLYGPKGPDGLQYGLLSAGDDLSTGSASVTGSGPKSRPLVKSAVVFTLGLPDGFGQIDVSNVWFQYGTKLCKWHYRGEENGSEGGGPPIPEPITLICLGSGIGILARYARKRLGGVSPVGVV